MGPSCSATGAGLHNIVPRNGEPPANLFIASIDFSIAFLVDLASGGSAKP